MPTAPTPAIPIYADGTILTATTLNNGCANLANLYKYAVGGFRTLKPLCVVTRELSPGGPASGVETVNDWDTAYANTDTIWMAAGGGEQASVLAVKVSGWYRCVLQVHWGFDNPVTTSSSNGMRACRIAVNGTAPANIVASDSRNAFAGEGPVTACSELLHLAVGAQVIGMVYQNSGVFLLTRTDFSASFMSLEYVGPY